MLDGALFDIADAAPDRLLGWWLLPLARAGWLDWTPTTGQLAAVEAARVELDLGARGRPTPGVPGTCTSCDHRRVWHGHGDRPVRCDVTGCGCKRLELIALPDLAYIGVFEGRVTVRDRAHGVAGGYAVDHRVILESLGVAA